MPQSRSPESSYYTVAWIAALPHERAAGEAMFDEEYTSKPSDFRKNHGDPNAYSWGKIGEHYVVVAALPVGEYGLTATATIAQGLRSSLPHVRIGLLVGIGAGVREIVDKNGRTVGQRDIQLGDIAISSPEGTLGGVVQFDFVKAKVVDGEEVLERKGFLNSPPLALRAALSKLQANYMKRGSSIPAIIAEAFGRYPAMEAEFNHPGLKEPETRRKSDVYFARDGNEILSEARKAPKTHYGIIASSNTLEKSANHRDTVLARLAKEQIEPVCFEMEAAGLMNNFPCLVIRGICDYGDQHKNDDWQNYAAITAAAFAKEFLSCVEAGEVQDTQKIGEIVLEKMSAIQSDIRHIHEDFSSQRRDQRLDWLCPHDYSEQFESNRAKSQPGTGQWFLNHPGFVDWVNAADSCILFCPGDPGTGKTIISTLVIEHLRSKETDAQIPVIYLFCDHGRQEEQTLTHFVASLLRQLAFYSEAVLSAIKRLHSDCARSNLRPKLEEMQLELKHAFKSLASAFVIIDALDECEANTRSQLVQAIRSQTAHCEVHLLATSRDEDNIRELFKSGLSIRIKASEGDVRRYLEARTVEFILNLVPDLRSEVIEGVVNAAEGMFLLARLHMDNLKGQLTVNEVRETLGGLRSGVEAYSGAYEAAMERLQRQDPRYNRLAKRVFAWVVHAKRPLRSSELEHALATQDGKRRLDKDDIIPVETALSFCAGLISSDDKSRTVRLVHYTAQEYFGKHWMHWFPDESVAIIGTCITYLSFDAFRSGPCGTDEELTQRFGDHQLLRYAAEHWGNHVRDMESIEDELRPQSTDHQLRGYDPMCESACMSFLGNENLVLSAAQAMLVDHEYKATGYASVYPTKTSALHITARFGNVKLSYLLVQNRQNANITDEYDMIPLQYAAENGHKVLVRTLLSSGADVNAQDMFSRNALFYASYGGHVEVVQMLLQSGADVNATENQFSNALYVASARGYAEVVRVLLDNRADDNSEWGKYGNSLCIASANGHADVVQMLLDSGANVNAHHWRGFSVLYGASGNGHAEVVRMLLGSGADVNARDEHGRYALFAASTEGHVEVMDILRAAGAIMYDFDAEESETSESVVRREAFVPEESESDSCTDVDSDVETD